MSGAARAAYFFGPAGVHGVGEAVQHYLPRFGSLYLLFFSGFGLAIASYPPILKDVNS